MNQTQKILCLVFRALGLALGIAVVVLNILGQLEVNAAITMLGLGLAAVSVSLLPKQQNDAKESKK